MDISTLARKMLEWQDAREKLDILEAEIKAAVMEVGSTQTVGIVRASYSKGVGKYDYALACAGAGLDETDLREYAKTTYDFRQAALDHQINLDQFYKPGEPSVSLKLLKG